MMKDLEETIASTVQAAVQAQAKAKLIDALGGTDAMMDSFIRMICTRKVERNYKQVPLLDSLLEKAVDEAIRQIVADLLSENEQQIKAEVAKRVRADAKSVAEALVTRVLPQGSYRVNLKEIEPRD